MYHIIYDYVKSKKQEKARQKEAARLRREAMTPAEKKLDKALAEQELINAEYDAQLKEAYGLSLDALVESIVSKAHKRNK